MKISDIQPSTVKSMKDVPDVIASLSKHGGKMHCETVTDGSEMRVALTTFSEPVDTIHLHLRTDLIRPTMVSVLKMQGAIHPKASPKGKFDQIMQAFKQLSSLTAKSCSLIIRASHGDYLK